jgi:hypothetical protein
MIGAAAGMVFRLLLAVPGDLCARLLTGLTARGTAGSFVRWLETPEAGGVFFKPFVLLTCWLGALAGVILLWRRGNRRIDVLYGLVAGAMAGLAGSATFACLLPSLDALPRFVWQQIGNPAGWMWIVPWIALAALCWTVQGAVIGFVLGCLGRPGAIAVGCMAEAVSWVFRLCGMKRVAAYFALQ